MLLDLRCTGFSHVAGTPLDQERTQERFMGKFGTKTLNFREEFFSFSSHFGTPCITSSCVSIISVTTVQQCSEAQPCLNFLFDAK